MTIGILSWGSHETLINTLKSYQKHNLDLLNLERIIYFQAMTDEDVKIANRFGYKWIGSNENVGIAEGYKRLVEYATGDLFLFLENDWELIQDPTRIITEAQFLLHEDQADVVRLRHRWQPGTPLWTLQFRDHERDKPTHLLDSVHWQSAPEELFSEIKRDKFFETWYITTSRNANWSNNPHMAKTQWLKDNILSRLSGDIEISLQSWWEQQDFKVAQGDGLFTHNRKD